MSNFEVITVQKPSVILTGNKRVVLITNVCVINVYDGYAADVYSRAGRKKSQ